MWDWGRTIFDWIRSRIKSFIGGGKTGASTAGETDSERTASRSRGRRRLDAFLPAAIRRSFLAKVLLGLIVIVLTVGVIGGFFYLGINDDLESQIDQQVRATTALHGTVYDDWFTNRRRTVEDAVRQGPLVRSDREAIIRTLETERTRSDAIGHYHYVSTETGEILASSNANVTGTNVRAYGIGTEQLQAREFISPERYTAADGTTAIAIGRTINFPNVDRMLLAEIPVEDAGPPIEQTVRGATTSIVTREGKTLLGPTVDAEIPEVETERTTVRTADASIFAFHPLSTNAELLVVTRTPRANAFQVRDAVLRSFGTTILLTFLILVGVTLLGGRTTIRDLTRLVDRARRMAEGNLDVDLETTREDEIGVLYEEFDEMRRQLKERIRVAERSRQEAEQLNEQLQVLDRLLRHNVNNDMTTIILRAESISQESEGALSEHANQIIEKSNDLLARTEKQREITRVLSAETERKRIDLVRLVEHAVETVTREYPGATITFDVPGSVVVMATPQLQAAVTELLENAVVHSGDDRPEITITVSRDGDTVRIAIADDGPGLPEVERQILTGTQSVGPLDHGSGVGLWLVFWTVRRSGGQIRIEDGDPHGTVVVIELTAAPDSD